MYYLLLSAQHHGSEELNDLYFCFLQKKRLRTL
jgi:hypothetical protein